MRLPTLLLAILLPLTATAADPAKNDRPTAPPPPGVGERSGPIENPEGVIEPEVTITTRGTEVHEEYRANGRLYMVKVVPAKGKPYYLLYDETGRARRSEHEPSTIVPQWIIKSW